VSYNLNLLLHKDFPHPSSSSKSSTRPRSTTEPNESTEHSTIQKGGVHCNMAATDAGRLLSTLWCSVGFYHEWWKIFICFVRMDLHIHFGLLKLINKPHSLLLEARRSQTNSEGHNQTGALSLFFELDPVDRQKLKTTEV